MKKAAQCLIGLLAVLCGTGTAKAQLYEFDYAHKRPAELLHYLRTEVDKRKIFLAGPEAMPHNWVKEEDVPGLMTLLGSQRVLPLVMSTHLSTYPWRTGKGRIWRQTEGLEAIYLLHAYFTGHPYRAAAYGLNFVRLDPVRALLVLDPAVQFRMHTWWILYRLGWKRLKCPALAF